MENVWKSALSALLWVVSSLVFSQGGADLRINEIMVANLDQFVDPSWNYGPWVELYNPTDAAVQIRGYWVSDDPEHPKKVRIPRNLSVPAGGFATLWFDHHDKYCITQLPLKLDVDGGVFILSQADGTPVATLQYPPCVPRASYARTADGAGEWQWSSTPTPGSTNQDMTFCQERLPAPEVNEPSQIFTGSIWVRVTIPEGCTLRYTTDGRTPTLKTGDTSTDGVFAVSGNRVFRFALFRNGYLSSPVVTRTYLLRDKNFSLPVISVVTNPDNLYSNEMGIFVRGVNGRPGLGQSSKCNWNMDWDRPCNFELLDAEGHSLLNQGTEMKRCGGWSRAEAPYSFKIHAVKADEFMKTLDYPFFEAKPYLRHKTLQMRNGGNDSGCRVLDPFLQQIVATSGLDVDYQEYQPVAHYINGVYKGVINMREPNNKHHVYANYGLDDEEIDLFEMDADSGYVQQCGTSTAWKRLLTLARLSSVSSYYEQIEQLLDIDEFCNYMAVEFYVGCTDWPQNNLKAFRPIQENGRFRFILYDLDHSFNTTSPFSTFAGKSTYRFNTLYGEPVSNYTKEIEVVTLFTNLLRNETFRRHFIDTFCLVAGSVFEPTRCREIISRLATRVNDMQVLGDNGYGKNVSPWGTANNMINSLNNARQKTLINALKNYGPMKLTTARGQTVSLSSNLATARLQVNGQTVPTGRFSGTLFQPATLKASAPAGYTFLGWAEKSGADAEETVLLDKGGNWYYYDKGSLDGKNWNELSYNTFAWKQGTAPLGYSTRYTTPTTLSYGGNADNKYITYYFRRNFNIDKDIPEDATFVLEYDLDDGMVVYVNGTEAGRDNMPAGTVKSSTVSVTYAGDSPNSGTMTLDRKLFKKGQNLIAVEVHNNSATSADIYWEASLVMRTPLQYNPEMSFLSREPEMELPKRITALNLVACYQKDEEVPEQPRRKVVINEVSAGNSIYVNEYFKKGDWIELYNTTAEDIDLAGMYLSDDPGNSTKCQIQPGSGNLSTILPARGYRIVWCDDKEGLSQLHVNFKLANEDGALVMLTAADQSWADTLLYCAPDGSQTVGRFPDGGTARYLMSKPTIEKANAMNSYTSLWERGTSGSGMERTSIRSAGLSLAYASGELRVKSEEDSNVSVTIYGLSGVTLVRHDLQLEGWHGSVSVDDLPAGVYIAQLRDSQGNTCSIKFRK